MAEELEKAAAKEATPAAPEPKKAPVATEETPAAPAPPKQAPKAETPKAEAPKADATKAAAPKAEAPKAEAPKAAAPKAEAPKAEAPKADAPKADATKAAAPKADAPKAEAAKADAPNAEASDGEAPAAAPTAMKRGKGRGGRAVPVGIAHIRATFNNTSVAITDPIGNVVAWSSAGRAGFKGSRKSTAFAATLVGQDAARQAVGRGMHEVEVRVQGAGSGRESAIRALQGAGLNVSVIRDVTPIPHNGCRPRKRRRV